MRHVALLPVIMCWLAPQATALQPARGAAPGQPAIRACSLLTHEDVGARLEQRLAAAKARR